MPTDHTEEERLTLHRLTFFQRPDLHVELHNSCAQFTDAQLAQIQKGIAVELNRRRRRRTSRTPKESA